MWCLEKGHHDIGVFHHVHSKLTFFHEYTPNHNLYFYFVQATFGTKCLLDYYDKESGLLYKQQYAPGKSAQKEINIKGTEFCQIQDHITNANKMVGCFVRGIKAKKAEVKISDLSSSHLHHYIYINLHPFDNQLIMFFIEWSDLFGNNYMNPH